MQKFDHEIVLVGLLPKNDFLEADKDYGLENFPSRYRPYLSGRYPDYTVSYTGHHPPAVPEGDMNFFSNIKPVLREFSVTYNALAYSRSVLKANRAVKEEVYSGYFDFGEPDWNRLRYSLEKLRKQSKGKRLIVFTIPVLTDFPRIQEHRSPLVINLEKLAKELKFQYFDILPLMESSRLPIEQFYMTCDGHWSENGTKELAKAFLEKIPAYSSMQ